MTFADRLRQLREDRSMTQAGLAEASGLPLGSIRNYEQGQREPYWAVVFKLAAALGVSCDKFRDCVPDAVTTEAPAKQAEVNADAADAKPRAAKKGRKAKGE